MLADKAAVEADVQALKDLLAKANTEELTDEQVAEIKAGKEKLMESAQKLFTKMYEQAGAAAWSGRSTGWSCTRSRPGSRRIPGR